MAPASAAERDVTADLQAAIEHLYEVFAGLRLCHPEPCAHCYPAEEVARTGERLRTVPLRELALVDLHHVYTDGTPTWGDAEDLRYLLPRLMEVYVRYWESDEAPDLPFEVTYGLDAYFALGRLIDGGWRRWPHSRPLIHVVRPPRASSSIDRSTRSDRPSSRARRYR